jgi:hypothetical protein
VVRGEEWQCLIDLLPCGRREDWQDSPAGWPKEPADNRWATSQTAAALYGCGSRCPIHDSASASCPRNFLAASTDAKGIRHDLK